MYSSRAMFLNDEKSVVDEYIWIYFCKCWINFETCFSLIVDNSSSIFGMFYKVCLLLESSNAFEYHRGNRNAQQNLIAVITVEPAGKAPFVLGCIQTRLVGQYNGKWPISLVYMSKPLVTVITAISASFNIHRVRNINIYFTYIS